MEKKSIKDVKLIFKCDKYRYLAYISLILFVFSILLMGYTFCRNPETPESKYTDYNEFAKEHIEMYLGKTSENILLKSSDDAEIIKNIVLWENRIGLRRFNSNETSLRFSNDTLWYIFLKKANCGERAMIFEDMAKRTGLTYKHVGIDGYIGLSGDIDNHAWSEVFIEGEGWTIADSGFSVYPTGNNFTDFTDSRLIGPVYVFENGTCTEDRTISYIKNTGNITIISFRNGEPVPNASIYIELNHGNKSQTVVGRKIKLHTDDSGIGHATLGIYNNSSYTIKLVDSKGIYQFEGEEVVVLENGSKDIIVQVDDFQFNRTVVVFGTLGLLWVAFLILLFSRKNIKKEKHKKL